MADVNIGAKLTVDTGASLKSINDINKEIKSASEALKEAKIGTDEYRMAQENLKKAQEELSASTKEKTSTFAQLKDQLKGTVPAFDGAAQGASGLGKQLLALLANPIVLMIAGVVAGLKFLYDAFTYSVEGGNKVKAMFAGINAGVHVIVDSIMKVGQGLIKFFSGDWKGASKDMEAAFGGISDKIIAAGKDGKRAAEMMQEISKQERESLVARAAQNAAIVKSKELLNDETASIEDRKKALKEVGDIEKKVGLEDIEIAKKKREAFDLAHKHQTELNKEEKEERAALSVEISNKQEETARHTIQLQRQARTLGKQERALDAEEKKKEEEEEKQRLDNIREYTNKIKKLQQEQDLAIITDTYQKEKLIAQNALADSIREIELNYEQKKLSRVQANNLILEEQKLHNLKLMELDKKHNAEVQKNEEELAKAKADILSRGKARMIALEKEEIDGRIKQRTAFIKSLDSELKLAQARKIATIEMEQEAFNTKRALERQSLIDAKANAEEIAAFDNDTAREQIALDNAVRDAKTKNLEIVAQAANAFSGLIGQQTLAGKILGVTSATIDTYIAAGKALASAPPPFGAIAMAGTIAMGISNVKRIIDVQVPGASGGSTPSLPSAPLAPSAPLTPTIGTTRIDPNQVQQMGNAAAPRAFVVESDIRNSQERITMLNRAARIGG